MTITNRVSLKSVEFGITPIDDVVDAPTIGTATAGIGQATVPFTAAATGGPATSFTAISTPGSVTSSSATSPITVTGLTADTAYTFKVYGSNASGTWSGVQSAASNSVTVLGTAFESIASASPNGSTTVTFNNIPQTYKHLQIRGIYKDSWSTLSYATFEMWLNNTAGSGTNYNFQLLNGNGGAVNTSNANNRSSIDGFTGPTSASGLENMFGAFIIDIHNYTSTTNFKTVRYVTGVDANQADTNWQIRLGNGLYKSTSAITRIDLHNTAYNFVSGTSFALYGIKG